MSNLHSDEPYITLGLKIYVHHVLIKFGDRLLTSSKSANDNWLKSVGLDTVGATTWTLIIKKADFLQK